MERMVVSLLVSQAGTSPLKAAAAENMRLIRVTPEVSQADRSPLNAGALRNIEDMSVTLLVSHATRSGFAPEPSKALAMVVTVVGGLTAVRMLSAPANADAIDRVRVPSSQRSTEISASEPSN